MKKFILIIFCLTILSTPCFAQKSKKDEPESTETTTPIDPLSVELKEGEIFNCETHISYEWQKPGDKEEKKLEFFQTLVERGKSGPRVKSSLESRLTLAKDKALLHCKNFHNVGRCTSEKLRLAKNDLMHLDFQSKRALSSSLIQSCENLEGECLGASNSEINCNVYRSPDAK